MNNPPFIWTTREEGVESNGIDVSSHGPNDYRKLSPFSHSKDYQIPIPGDENERADSVEGIWQGLKLIGRSFDPSLFRGKPHKRKGNPAGHIFGNQVLGYQDARQKIYVPAYTYHVINNALESVTEDLKQRMETGPVHLFDVETNPHIRDISKPYAHSALLADILNLLCKAPIPPFNTQRFESLNSQLEETLGFREGLTPEERNLLDDIITFAYLFSGNEVKETFALRALQTGKIRDNGRLESYAQVRKK